MYFGILGAIGGLLGKGIQAAGGLLGGAAAVVGPEILSTAAGALQARLGGAVQDVREGLDPRVREARRQAERAQIQAQADARRRERQAISGPPLPDAYQALGGFDLQRIEREGTRKWTYAQSAVRRNATVSPGVGTMGTVLVDGSGPFTPQQAAAAGGAVSTVARRAWDLARRYGPEIGLGLGAGAVGNLLFEQDTPAAGVKIHGMPGVRVGSLFHVTPTGRVMPNRRAALIQDDTLYFFENVLPGKGFRRRTTRRCRPR